jgi:hypothetical protein
MAAERVPFGDNVAVSSLDSQIDDLYRLPLSEFTAARNALVKTQRGADATRVRTLAKPTVVAWAVNQVYWQTRATFDRLMKAGDALRRAQLAALAGKHADLRSASEAHRRALADAVKEAERLAAATGSHPAPDALMRTFEALSLAKEAPAQPGRLADALQPAGFEALAGVTPQVRLKPDTTPATSPPSATSAVRGVRLQADHERKEAKRRAAEDKKRAAEEKKRAAAVKKAEAELERVRAKMRAAEEAVRRARG